MKVPLYNISIFAIVLANEVPVCKICIFAIVIANENSLYSISIFAIVHTRDCAPQICTDTKKGPALIQISCALSKCKKIERVNNTFIRAAFDTTFSTHVKGCYLDISPLSILHNLLPCDNESINSYCPALIPICIKCISAGLVIQKRHQCRAFRIYGFIVIRRKIVESK